MNLRHYTFRKESEQIVALNEEVIKGPIRELVRGSVEETLNGCWKRKPRN